jgi:hypothetical protein
VLVDSGSMYRAVTLLVLERGTPVDDEPALADVAREVSASFRLELRDGENLRVFVDEREVTDRIRSLDVGETVSPVSKAAAVREEMVRLQRCLVEGRGAVVEGRDIGTTVLPDAPVKIFLDASQRQRSGGNACRCHGRDTEAGQDRLVARGEPAPDCARRCRDRHHRQDGRRRSGGDRGIARRQGARALRCRLHAVGVSSIVLATMTNKAVRSELNSWWWGS